MKLSAIFKGKLVTFYGRPAKFDPSSREFSKWFVSTHKDPR